MYTMVEVITAMITLSKIASIAHVSVSTVSKAFSGSDEVNEQTREAIFEIAKQHNCFKKYYNVKYPKFVIAVICPEFRSRFYASYLAALQEEISKYNCEICVAATDFSATKEQDLLDYYTKHTSVDGIIIVNPGTDLNVEVSIPIVAIEYSGSTDDIIKINGSIYEAIYDAVSYFKEMNIKSVGFIGEKLTKGKFAAFKNAMKENDIEINDKFIVVTDKRFEKGGYYAMNKLFERGSLPRVIVAAYDNMAIGAMHSIFEHGLKIPDDIAVLGMDDNSESKYINPPLSSINLEIGEVCRIATREIMNKLTGKPVKFENLITHKLQLRKSTEINTEK